ncbi:MAG: hypothetical protein GSR78_04990 [Desulfurococcales archaeon]|nr:hypothetical protein [Desulfurococcales archaeon]
MENIISIRKETMSDLIRVKETIRNSILFGEALSDSSIRTPLHAIAYAIGLSRAYNTMAVVTVTDSMWNGLSAYADNTTGRPEIHLCSLQLGIPYECDTENVLGSWPTGEYTVKTTPSPLPRF